MKRRICWPNPDSVCLEGGCSYCNKEEFQTYTVIKDYIDSHDNPAFREPLLIAWQQGLDNNFFNHVDIRK